MIIIEEGGGFMRPFGLHVYQAGRFTEGTLGADYEAVAVIGAAIGHVVALRTSYFVAREIGG